jgi:hypothetical protein
LAEVLIERDDDLEDAEMKDRETKNGGGAIMMNRAAPEALLEFLLLTPPLPSFLLLSAPTTAT